MAEYLYLDNRGVILPDTSNTLAEVEAEWRAAFGQDLTTTPDTPQGVMITAEATNRMAVARNNAQLANQINPDLAGGVFLDAIAALFGLERAEATRSQVPGVVLTGRPNTFIPAGVRARSDGGDLFALAGAVTLDGDGIATGAMQSVETGPVAAGPGEITAIVDSVLGWETVTNPNAAVLGEREQSDQALRNLRRRTLALQGISTVEAHISEVSAVPNVRSMQFRENIAPTTQTIDGIEMVAHSVWACVDGGTDEAVALALLRSKTAGAAWNGPVEVEVVEPVSGQEYTVKFERPTPMPVLVRVTVRARGAQSDPQEVIPQAVVDYAEGRIDGEDGFTVGANVSPFELAGAVSRVAPELFVSKVEVTLASEIAWVTSELVIPLNAIAVTSIGSVTVVLE